MSAILITCSIVLLLMCSAYITVEYYSYRNTIKNNVSTLAVIIASNSSAALAFDSPADANEILDALKANKHIVAACLFDKNGNLFAKYPADISNGLLPAKPQKAGYHFENSFFEGFEPVIQKSERLGALYIKSDVREMYDQLNHFTLIALILIAGLLLVAYLLSGLFKKTISNPILSLEKTARVVSEKNDYTVRAVKTGNDELGALTDTFNHMLTQIERQDLELKKAEIESSKLAAIVESSNDAIVSKTLDGTITSWNDSAERIFGYAADEIRGQSILKVIPADLQHEEEEILSRLKNGERVEQHETRRITKDNKVLDVSITISLVKDAGGEVVGSSQIVRDISEKKLEEQRKNDFIAIISHELKTPLTSMKTYIQVLLQRTKKDANSFEINALTRADIQAKKMTTMIQDFLSLARLEEGKIQVNKQLFDLPPLIQEIAGDAQYLTSNHKIELNNCASIRLYADKDKIGQVLVNLLTNAIKYSPKGGKITIGCERGPDKVKIYVSDEGVGIGPADQAKLFDRFYRVKNEKTKTVSGFGIGLYLASEILRYHNSKIEVKSEEGVGSTFYFYLELS